MKELLDKGIINKGQAGDSRLSYSIKKRLQGAGGVRHGTPEQLD
jgi:hypothetical protein